MSYELEVLRDNPVGFWMMDSGSSPVVDISKNQNTGSLTGTLTKVFPLISGSDYAVRFSTGVSAAYNFDPALYVDGAEKKVFALEGWVLFIPKTGGTISDQVILGSTGNTDGLIINDKTVKFILKFDTAPDAEISYTAPTYEKMHVVGVYAISKIWLYVNSVLVASQDLTSEQMADVFMPNSPGLQTGVHPGGQTICVNGLAAYDIILPPERVAAHFVMGSDGITTEEVIIQNDGIPIEANRDNANVFLSQTWDNFDDFSSGYLENCVASKKTDVLSPSLDDDDLSLSGVWQTSFPLDPPDTDTLYGVMIDWDGKGIIVSASLDATTWTQLVSGIRTSLVPSGFNPAGTEDMFIQVEFNAGLDITQAYLNSITAIVIKDGILSNKTNRTITLIDDVTINKNIEPFDLRDDAGIYLNGGTINFTVDVDVDFDTLGAVEMMVKVIDTTDVDLNINGAIFADPADGEQYKNGVRSATQPTQGEWTLMHFVPTTPLSATISLTHPALIVSSIVLYKSTLSAGDVLEIYDRYTGPAIVSVLDSNTADITEAVLTAEIYHHDWSILGGG